MSSAADAGQGMLCPVCKVTLSISERQGVEIDFCPQCRGVWLDRGELDQIIERSETAMPPPPRAESREDPQPWGHPAHRHRSRPEESRSGSEVVNSGLSRWARVA